MHVQEDTESLLYLLRLLQRCFPKLATHVEQALAEIAEGYVPISSFLMSS